MAMVWEGCLRAMGTLCITQEVARKQLVDSKQALSRIQSALEDPSSPGIRAAAALCVLALSRNVKNLRLNVLTTEMAQSLCRLLRDKDMSVQINAAAVLCNLVLEFSSVKDTALEMGVLETLAAHTSSQVLMLRLYSAWALRNLAHKSSINVKKALMQALGWPQARALLSDPDEGVQEQAICLLRNLCMDAAEHITAAYEWGGADVLAVLEDKLDPTKPVPNSLRVHALYTIVNSLTGSEATKEQIMASNVPALLLHHMRTSPDHEVRLPAVWCIINLTWAPSTPPAAANAAAGGGSGTSGQQQNQQQQGAGAAGAGGQQPPAPGTGSPASTGAASDAAGVMEARLRRLRALGAQESLQELLADPSLDVRERARHALDLMRTSAGATAVGST